jgi:hypothetical protein
MLQETAATAGKNHRHDFPTAFSPLARSFRLALTVMFCALYRDVLSGYGTACAVNQCFKSPVMKMTN